MAGVFDFFRKKKTDGNDLETVLSPEKQPNFLSQFMPEDPDKQRALARSLMMGGANMMAAGGPSANPTNLLQVLGQGLAGGVGAYDKSLEADLEQAKVGAASRANNVKLQQLQNAQEFASTLGADGDGAFSIADLKKLYQQYIGAGEYSAANSILERIQRLDDERRKDGMVMGDDGGYELAPGVTSGIFDTKRAESLGSAVGQNSQITAAQKDFVFGNDNPAFRAYELQQKKAGATGTDKFGGKSDELAAERFAGYQAEGLKAKETVANMGRLADLSRSIGTGLTANLKKTYGPYAQAMGIDVDGLDDIQLFDSMVSKIAPTLRSPGSGASSDLDVTMFLKSLPNLSNTTDGNALIAETTSAIEANKVRAAEIANKVFDENDPITWQEAEKQIQALPDPYNAFKKYKGAETGPANRPSTSGPSAKTGRVAAGPVVVSTEEQFNALPKGTSFRFDDDATVRVKQ